jgi:hypothetical protein
MTLVLSQGTTRRKISTTTIIASKVAGGFHGFESECRGVFAPNCERDLKQKKEEIAPEIWIGCPEI